jgi:predicted Zn-ribbon and HTH transcriptional regulator
MIDGFYYNIVVLTRLFFPQPSPRSVKNIAALFFRTHASSLLSSLRGSASSFHGAEILLHLLLPPRWQGCGFSLLSPELPTLAGSNVAWGLPPLPHCPWFPGVPAHQSADL